MTFFLAGTKTVLRAGGFVSLPGASPHVFRVSAEGPATMLIVSPTASTFGAFVREMGEPAISLWLPAPSQLDFARLWAVSAKHGSIFVGPLPE